MKSPQKALQDIRMRIGYALVRYALPASVAVVGIVQMAPKVYRMAQKEVETRLIEAYSKNLEAATYEEPNTLNEEAIKWIEEYFGGVTKND